jgi:hypothetical protein
VSWSGLEVRPGRDRTAQLVLNLQAEWADSRPRPGTAVTGARLTMPGVKVVQPRVPVPLGVAGTSSGTVLVFSLTVDRCDVALGGARPTIDVRVTSGTEVDSLQDYGSGYELSDKLLRYLVDVCR